MVVELKADIDSVCIDESVFLIVDLTFDEDLFDTYLEFGFDT